MKKSKIENTKIPIKNKVDNMDNKMSSISYGVVSESPLMYENKNISHRWLVGVDEVGRGPLAGPVTVGTVAIPFLFDKYTNTQTISESKSIYTMSESDVENMYVNLQKKIFEISGKKYPIGVDSKKMNEKDRDFWYQVIVRLVENGDLYACVGSCSAYEIDEKGIAVCIKKIIDENLREICDTKLPSDSEVHVMLDGGLKTGVPVVSQQTIIKGDEKQMVISLASVFAKVSRDLYMKNLSENPKFAGLYQKYGFGAHKGYGTLTHRQAIQKYGPSDEHRRTFCENILKTPTSKSK